jgi:hypothetical protein
MGSVSSEEGSGSGSDQEQSERCGSYSPSADVSESESCSSFSCRRFDAEGGASSSMTSSPRPVAGNFGFSAPVMLPVIAGKDVVWDVKPEKRETDLSGTLSSFLYLLFLVIIGYFHFASKFGAKSRRGSEICAYFLVCLSTISSLHCLSFCSLCFISSGK